jgi:hypothetical protein
LKHRVSLSKACNLVVKLDETRVPLPLSAADASAPDAR